mgnify:FL=1
MTQEELRTIYKARLEREKQKYIGKCTHIDVGILSKFKNDKIDLYPHLFARLEEYLTGGSNG